MLQVSSEVERALADQKPVVALESTVIAHGLPWPRNLETALQMEAVIRAEGAVPATIGILNGQPVAGLSPEEIEILATSDGVAKVSLRDVAAVVARGGHGATTVAASIWLAASAGIRVLSTGGVGGVHRGGKMSLDLSADLIELGRTPVAVVCAGAKAVLDLPRTLEVFETLGVPVVGYGTDEFPAFYARQSGLQLEHRVETPREAARLMAAQWSLGLDSGIVFACPPPSERALGRSEVEALVAEALERAAAEGIRGKALTPYLLQQLAELSGGRTLEANVALLEQNARIGARIAADYAKLDSP